jgi:hypothetical protein
MNKKLIFLIIFLALLAIGGYFLYTQLGSGGTVKNGGIVNNLETNFEVKIFSDHKFLGLKDYLAAPVTAGEKGKINPFMKF